MGELKRTRVVIQLADRSNVYPEGLIEDVLVKVDELIFPADFYVLDMGTTPPSSSVILLGRPFMKTARTKIDMDKGILTCEIDGEKVAFNVFEAMKYPHDREAVNFVSVFNEVPRTTFYMMNNQEPLEWALHEGITDRDVVDEEGDLGNEVMMLNSLEEMPHVVAHLDMPIPNRKTN